ncbi:ATP-binding protein [Halobium salinum]|uniref:ATP-binding protein n=1 Tax=Halobium salinum TaxID=1364940 RepID=A0ABD5PCP1_9EURY|nr:ATPase [Halobium salinum]
MHVLGRLPDARGPVGHLGSYRAPDGSSGASVGLDLDRPHAALVVGKRGTGKSHTLGVLAEATARVEGVAPVVVDPMGVFAGLAEGGRGERAAVPASVIRKPTVPAAAIPPAAWPELVGLDPAGGPGALVWSAARDSPSLDGICRHVADADATAPTRRAARNHLDVAGSWGVFESEGGDDPGGAADTESTPLDADSLLGGAATVVDCAGLPEPAMGAVCAAVAGLLYDARVEARRGEYAGAGADRLPWLLLDEAHAFFGGVADGPLRTLLTRGRAPGVSLVAATQRPSALPPVAVSQADLLVSHRLTSEADLDALAAGRPTYLDGSWAERLPSDVGEALVVDDATESVHAVRVRERDTPHGGASPRASSTPESGSDRPGTENDAYE